MNDNERTRELLITYCQTYPKLQIQDIFKFLYQSAFGCEHLLASENMAADNIRSEYEQMCGDEGVLIEPLDGGYSRVHLSYLSRGLGADTLGRLLFLSARKEMNAREELLKKLNVVRALALENLLPFSAGEFEKAAAVWEAQDYQALHHSAVFREAYRPAYRVIANVYIPILPLLAEIDRRLEDASVKVAIEGGSASGKTTLGQILESIYNCTVFHMDDFFLRPEQRTQKRYAQIGGNIDWERFLEEVLQPLSSGEKINYKRFDCASMSLTSPVQVIPEKLVIVEGAYAMHPQLAAYYDLSAFLDISPQLQAERIRHRNTPEMAERFFNEWIPLEKKYFEAENIKERCDVHIPVI